MRDAVREKERCGATGRRGGALHRLKMDEVGGMGEARWDVKELLALGSLMDTKPAALVTVAEEWLKVRDREGVERPLRANAVQRAFERECGKQNIVLKARQMGMTTWVAGRLFLKTITARGGVVA